MSSNRVALDLAAFLDSPEALRLDAPSTGEIRRLVEAFLEVCYLDLGKAPHLLEDHDVEAALRQLLARRLKPRDPEAEHVPAVLAAFFDFLEGAKPVMHAYEIRRALDAHGDAVVEAVRSDETPRVRRKQAPFVHGAPKLNRNDPCSCGSGKKYKKCHGKNA